jgi:hypothetical protein
MDVIAAECHSGSSQARSWATSTSSSTDSRPTGRLPHVSVGNTVATTEKELTQKEIGDGYYEFILKNGKSRSLTSTAPVTPKICTFIKTITVGSRRCT